jgi:glycosyltransferase involved in cell wall biosynthesis
MKRAPDTRHGERKPHLFMIGPIPPPYGGVGAVFQSFLDSDLQQHFRITVVDTSKKDAREIVSDPGVSLRDGLHLAKTLAELGLKLAQDRPDVAFLTPVGDHSLVREAACVRMLRLCGAGIVCQFHARYEGELFVTGRPWARRFLGPLLAPADRILVLSEGLRQYFSPDFTRERTGVLSNFVDTATYRPLPVPRPPSARPTVFFLGRLSAPKGLWDLLAAVPPVAAAVPNVRFVLGGTAEFPAVEQELAKRITQEGLAPYVELPGILTGAEKLAAFAAADCFCLPSHLENQPVVLLEAMAAGLPVVSTRVGTIPELVTEGREGFLVTPGDRAGLAAALIRVLGDPELRAAMGGFGRSRVDPDFDRQSVVNRLIAELEAVCAARRPARRAQAEPVS